MYERDDAQYKPAVQQLSVYGRNLPTFVQCSTDDHGVTLSSWPINWIIND